MTIGVNNRNDAIGNGAVDTYPYQFKIFAATDLEVKVRDLAGVETTLTYLTHYTVTNVGRAAGGNVALVNGAFAWLDGDGDLLSGYALAIRRVRPLTQLTDIRNQGGFFPDVHEDTFDHLMMVDQQQQDELDRSLKIVSTEDGSVLATTVPAAAQRANRVVGFDDDGNLEMLSVLTTVYGVRSSEHVATAAQTVFDPTFTYVTGVNALSVYVNGLRMVRNVDYQETSESRFTMLYPLAAGDRVSAYAGQETTGLGATLASLCTYILGWANAVARSVQDWIRDQFINVKDFGATGDGVTNDALAIQRAFAAAMTRGGGTVFFPYGDYNLGNRSAFENIIALDNPSNLNIIGDGARLKLNTTDNSQPCIFSITSPRNMEIRGLRFQDTGTDLAVEWRGARCITLLENGVAGFSGQVRIRDCIADDVVTFLQTTVDGTSTSTTAGARLRGVLVQNCVVRDSFYGINCQNQGDGLRAIDFRCENVRRAYFPYGVQDHNVELSVYHDGVALGAESCCLIKRYAADTKHIKLRASFFGSAAQYATAVTLEHEPVVTGTGVIDDIDIDLHISPDIATPNAMTPFRCRSYTSAGVLEAAATNNRWDNVRLSGSLGAFNTGGEVFVIGATQSVEGKLTIDPSIQKSIRTALPHYAGFVVRTAHNREFRTLKGSLTTQVVKIPTLSLDSNAFALRVRTLAHEDSTALIAADMTYREDIIFGYNAGGAGGAGINATTNLHNVVLVSDATITYAAVGDNIEVAFAGAAYNNANAMARVEVEYLLRGPMYSS